MGLPGTDFKSVPVYSRLFLPADACGVGMGTDLKSVPGFPDLTYSAARLTV